MRAAVFLFILIFSYDFASAQTVTLLSPNVDQTVYEGDDYATQVLNNPWDENERRDIGWEENIVGSGAGALRSENGILSGTYASENGYFYPLFQGFTHSIFAEGLPGDRSLPRFGRNQPVDTSRYTFVSYRLNMSARSVASISWSKTTQTENGGWPIERGTYVDGYYGYTQAFARQGWHTYGFEMSDLPGTFGVGLFDGSWTGQVMSLRIEPGSFVGAGTKFDLDWVRLVDPNSAPRVTVNWSTSNVNSIPNRVISVAYTTDPGNLSQATTIAEFPKSDPGTFQYPLAALPAGDYYFFVFAHNPGHREQILATSALSNRIRILPAPTAYFTSPTQLSGQDYSTTVRGDPWDMSGAEDVDNLRFDIWPDLWRQFSGYYFDNGVFSAVANGPLPGNPHSDVQVHLPISPANPIDTHKYRYLTYKIEVDPSNHPTISQKVADGWVMRVVGWNHLANVTSHGSDTSFLPAAHVLYEGNHTYTYDLWDESSEALDLGVAWRSNPWMYFLRVDPLEVITPTRFWLDYVMLTAEPRPDAQGVFPISFVLEGSEPRDVSLYYDNDKSGFDGSLITSFSNLSPGEHTYNWDLSGAAADQRLYVYVVVSHGGSTRKYYAPVPIVTGQYVDPVPPPLSEAPVPRAAAKFKLIKVAMSTKKIKQGKSMSFTAAIESSLPLRYVDVIGKVGKKELRLKLRYAGGINYKLSWKAKRVTKNSKDTIAMTLHAQNSEAKRLSKSLGKLVISK